MINDLLTYLLTYLKIVLFSDAKHVILCVKLIVTKGFGQKCTKAVQNKPYTPNLME